MKNFITKKIVAFLALGMISCGIFAQQLAQNNDQELGQKLLQVIQKSADIDSFRKVMNNAGITRVALEADKNKAITEDEKFTNFFITQKVMTPEFGDITLHEYAKKSGKKSISNAIDQMVFHFLWYRSSESKNFDALKVLINQSDFNPNLKLSLREQDESDASDVLRVILGSIISNQVPLDIIDLLLEKGASLTTFLPVYKNASEQMAAERKLQNWRLPLEQVKRLPESLGYYQEDIANLTAYLLKTTNAEEKVHINKQIVSKKQNYDNLKNSPKYMNDLIAIIKKHAQKRGETEILKGIVEYEKTLKQVQK